MIHVLLHDTITLAHRHRPKTAQKAASDCADENEQCNEWAFFGEVGVFVFAACELLWICQLNPGYPGLKSLLT